MINGHPLDHIALVVADLEEAERLYHSLGFGVAYRERVEDQGVDIVGMRAGECAIELLKPFADESPLVRYRDGKETRLHHIAYRVDNIEGELARLKQLGMKLIDEAPRRGAHGNLIAFIHPSSTADTLIEICQRSEM
jgi:methylmalonyl-CoA/ethylmalonyl-CoA epimerase